MPQTLSQTQQQQLKLSPQQVRFGRLLEMSLPEFEEEVKRMLDENPALETSENFEAPLQQKDDEGRDFNESAEELQRADYASDEEVPFYRTNISNASADDPWYEPVAVDNGPSGIASLETQLADLDIGPEEREVASYVINSLDSNGYLTRQAAAIADDFAMGAGFSVSPRLVERAIGIVRGLDPAGIGARDLRDCLLLQIERLPDIPEVRTARRILTDMFDLFSKKHYDRIRSQLKLSENQFDRVLRLIRSLNPKPGSLLEVAEASDRLNHITPDFEVVVDPSGKLSTVLLGSLPEIDIAPEFRIENIEALEKKGSGRREQEASRFLRERYDAAREFIDMANRREDTLRRVIQAMVSLQQPFVRTNDRSLLRPMVLRDIRELTGLDLSVISRATAGKYVMTPGGMVSLKSLFSESVNDEGDLSAFYIQSVIKKIIDGEDKSHPLSDEAICASLKERGLNVARRTVAKYRERMGFPVARLRRD